MYLFAFYPKDSKSDLLEFRSFSKFNKTEICKSSVNIIKVKLETWNTQISRPLLHNPQCSWEAKERIKMLSKSY